MCCESTELLDLPPEVVEMIAHYRRLAGERGWDWGDDRIEMFRWARFSLLGDVFAGFAACGDWATAVRDVVGDEPPPGIVVVRLHADGPTFATGPARRAIAGCGVPVDVILDSRLATDADVAVDEHLVAVPAGATAVQTIDVDGATGRFTVTVGDEALDIGGAVEPVAAARLHLSSPACARWSVVDGSGGAWFPDGVLRKWDVHHRPFFHGCEARLDVPAGALAVACARGIEYERTERHVRVEPGTTTTLELDPRRVADPAAHGWYGADLHIHMNYGGDLVCTPADAARMQRGEGLHLANFVAGNCQTSLVYDREALEQHVGRDLPWSDGEAVARMGVEYRNDLLGHVHALGPEAAPSRYYAGHERSDHPEDWPPNKAACDELRGLGATVGYPHPVFERFPDDGSLDAFFANPRSVEARELVVDAALGAVDSIDVLSPFDDEGAVFLYHRLLSCGLRLAATAGSNAFLSFAHGPGVASNPPGWCRVYAHLGDEPLGVDAVKAAIRSGRTVVTNGPWLTLTVNGHGPGSVLDLAPGDGVTIRAEVSGAGVDDLAIVGPDGVIDRGPGPTLRHTGFAGEPTWIAAVARGPGHDDVLDASALAHTSPVYVDIGGRRVGRAADARWCLGLLDRVAALIDEHGHFDDVSRTRRLHAYHGLIERARRVYAEVAGA
jgi:hypothetical protein